MPKKPGKGETKEDFISRCVAYYSEHSEGRSGDENAAICYTMWKDRSKSDTFNIDTVGEAVIDYNFQIDADESTFRIDESTGFLYCKARFTRTGVFKYNIDGEEYLQLRTPEEVFDQESLDSLKLKPIIYLHPDKDKYPDRQVTIDNIKDLQVGSIGTTIEPDGKFILGDICITDKDMIKSLVTKRKLGIPTELSGGYACKLEPLVGIHNEDGPYNCVQRKIRYNHVCLCPSGTGRAGREVKIMDTKASKEKNMPENLVNFTKKAINLGSFNMDSISANIPVEYAPVFESLSSKLDQAIEVIVNQDSVINDIKQTNEANTVAQTKRYDELQAQLDQTNEDLGAAKKQVEVLSDPNSPEIQHIIDTKETVCNAAKALNVDVANKTIDVVMLDCIKAVSPDFDPSGKSADYLNSRFDAIVEGIAQKAIVDSKNALGNFVSNIDSTASKPKDYRAQFIEKSKAACKN